MKSTVNIANRSCYLPLRDAVLCADCEFISSDRGDTCAVCGGTNLLRVSEVLGQAMPASQNPQADFGFMMLSLGCESARENARVALSKREKHV
ncbi:MAG TPA: hypothetical protein VJN64_09840 [Terriglobales bacterium]|nr:hypothetical protein [Terriglobales bacterium]